MKPRYMLSLLLLLAATGRPACASGLPVTAARPRLLVSPAEIARLQAKAAANDPSWLALKAQADTLAGYSIFQYIYATRAQEPNGTIFYDYEGSGWWESAMPLALAYRVTGSSTYLNQLLAIVDEMIAAQSRPENNPPIGLPPLEPDSYYPTRYLGSTIGVIYDWCYDQLGASRKVQMIALMDAYFDDMRANAYQINSNADGNYYGGHLLCAAFMGYALAGDDPRAQEMIDFARIRFDGTPSADLDPSEVPGNWFSQCFDGGLPSAEALAYQGDPSATGAPFFGGFDFQGWAYGTGEYTRILDYLLAVETATGENLFAGHESWFSQILSAEKEALFPDRFRIDPSGDWGGDYGAAITPTLPIRLARVLAGGPDGPAAEHFYYSEIDLAATYPDGYQFTLSPWEDFFFGDDTRPSQERLLPPYSTGFSPAYPQGQQGNGALAQFRVRSDWSPSATWASASMGTEWYDDHQHSNAGHIEIARGQDYLLVDAAQWMGAAGSSGLLGGCTEENNAAPSNTLYFDDFGDFMYTGEEYSGGQGVWGIDQVVADELTDSHGYVRSDLTTAYDVATGPAFQVGRKLDSFIRSFLYLRSADLFVVFDQVQVENSTNPLGQYVKHLRWHFPNIPTLAGKSLTMDQGASRLYLDTLLPASLNIRLVDESANPDPCEDTPPPCTAYGANSGTWRAEVNDPANPLVEPFLTVIQPGATARPQMTTANLSTLDGLMIGARIDQPGGETNLVFFNDQPGQVPAPVTSTSYSFSGPNDATHTLCGMQPGAAYTVSTNGSVVTVAQDAAGTAAATAAGVLRFRFASPTADLAPAALSFLSEPLGQTSASQPAVLANNGSASLAISSIVTGGDFAESDDCAGGVPAATNCTISVSFAPLQSGLRTGAVTITDNALSAIQTVSLAGVGDFLDVPAGNPFHDFVNKIALNGITAGCGGNDFCPGNVVLRSSMAVFLLRGEHGISYIPPAATGIFADVPAANPFAPWIEQLYAEGITGGCGTNPLAYCPGNLVTRASMAVFLLTAEHGSGYVPPPATGIFSDVAPSNPFAPWIEQLYAEGITGGCATNPLRYCPGSAVNRAQMAVFLVTTFGL